MTSSNWNTTLTPAEILQVRTWWESKGYDWDIVKEHLDASDTRAEIAAKIKIWLRKS